MNANLNAVFEKAKADVKFAKDLFADPASACVAEHLTLSTGDIAILNEVMKEVQKYFGEKLYIAAQSPRILGNTFCFFICQ